MLGLKQLLTKLLTKFQRNIQLYDKNIGRSYFGLGLVTGDGNILYRYVPLSWNTPYYHVINIPGNNPYNISISNKSLTVQPERQQSLPIETGSKQSRPSTLASHQIVTFRSRNHWLNLELILRWTVFVPWRSPKFWLLLKYFGCHAFSVCARELLDLCLCKTNKSMHSSHCVFCRLS